MLPKYDEEEITRDEAKRLECGDKLVFIDPREPDRRFGAGAKLHETVVTVKHVGFHGSGIEVFEEQGQHFILKCYHRIIEESNIAEDDFNAVFA